MIRILSIIVFVGLLVSACGRSEPESVVIDDEAANDTLSAQQAEEPLTAPEQAVVADVPASQPAEQDGTLVKVYKPPT